MCCSRFLLVLSLMNAALVAASCVSGPVPGSGADGLPSVEVRLDILGEERSGDVRSILSEESVETMITDVTLASYDAEGKIVNTLYYDMPGESMLLYVSGKTVNDVYALANMGDMTGAFPEDEAGVADIVYDLGSYEEVSRKGIPMCGVLKGCAYEEGLVRTVQMERLFAKLNVRILHTGLSDGQTETHWAYNLANRSLYLRQANRRLVPFADEGSRAELPGDVLEVSDYNPDLADFDKYEGSLNRSDFGPGIEYVKDTTVTLYVPENVQGRLLAGNTDPYAKDALSISDIDGRSYAGLCTYLEYNASKPDKGEGYYGDVTYRCYLGEDAVSDFSIRRNSRYDLTMNFTDGGFVLDGWKVVRGDNWVDTRTLCFVDDPFVVYPGTSVNVLVHYNRTSSSPDVGSNGYSSEWMYVFDEVAMADAGLTCTFMGEEKIEGRNGYADYYFRVSAADNARTGTSVPIKVMLKDGAMSDVSEICISEIGELTPIWDFCPRYVAQTGELNLAGAIEAGLPLKVELEGDAVLECVRTSDVSFRFTAFGEGVADVHVSSSDGSQTLDLSLRVAAPELKVSDVHVALAPDGAKGRLDYHYAGSDGKPLSNFSELAYMKYLKPVVSGCDYVSSDASDSYLDMYIDRLYSSGRLLDVGSYYQVSVGAADCSAVEEHSMRVYVVDPFENIDVLSVEPIHDYTLLGMSSVPQKVRNQFSSQLSDKLDSRYEISPVDADQTYVTSSFEPVWIDVFSYENEVYGSEYLHSDQSSSKGASVRLTQKSVYAATRHGAGLHELKLHVRNRHSDERISKTIAAVDVYVHTVIGASAAFGYLQCNSPSGGADGAPTVAGVYNSVAGTKVYDTASSARIYYMDVSVEYLTSVDNVFMFSMMQEDVVSGYDFYDGLDWVRTSRTDGELDLNQRFLYSVCSGGDQRLTICDEPYGFRKGAGAMLYRALAMTTSSVEMKEAQLRQVFLGYSSTSGGGTGLYSPSYDLHDMNKGEDMGRNVVSKNSPYYFSPRSCQEYRDASGRGYHVVHALEALVPSSSGWINLL